MPVPPADTPFAGLLPEYDPDSLRPAIVQPQKGYEQLEKHMGEIFSRAWLERGESALPGIREPKSDKRGFVRRVRVPASQQRNGQIRETVSLLVPGTNANESRSVSVRSASPNSPLASESKKLLSVRNYRSQWMVGTIDPLGSFAVSLGESYVENIEALQRMGFLERMTYNNRMKDYSLALIEAFRTIENVHDRRVETVKTSIEAAFRALEERRCGDYEWSEDELREIANADYFAGTDAASYYISTYIYNHPIL